VDFGNKDELRQDQRSRLTNILNMTALPAAFSNQSSANNASRPPDFKKTVREDVLRLRNVPQTSDLEAN